MQTLSDLLNFYSVTTYPSIFAEDETVGEGENVVDNEVEEKIVPNLKITIHSVFSVVHPTVQRPKNPVSASALLTRKILRVRKTFQYRPDDFKTLQTISKLSGQFQNCLDGFTTVRTVLKLSRRFQNCPDGFKTVRTVYKLSGRFINCPDGL